MTDIFTVWYWLEEKNKYKKYQIVSRVLALSFFFLGNHMGNQTQKSRLLIK